MMMPRIHLLYPLTLVRGFWEDMMSQAHSFITSSWTFYLQADDGKVVIFQVMGIWASLVQSKKKILFLSVIDQDFVFLLFVV